MRIFISGRPGCGKTTLIKEIIKLLKCSFSGFITEEIRENGRSGFKIIDIKNGNEGILASVNIKEGPRVSKYRVNVKSIEEIAIPSLERDVEIYIIDEIGRMELCSEKFRNKIKMLLTNEKNVLATLHRNLIEEYKKYGVVIWLTRENWDEILERVKSILRRLKLL